MKAITCHAYGDPAEVLLVEDIDEPPLAADQVLVAVAAASLNPADWHLVRGEPYLARLQVGLRRPGFTVPGSDVAGRVVAVGSTVTRFALGDEVFGTSFMHGFGAFAERVAVPERLLARKPATIGFVEAAAVPLAASTALQAVRDHGRVEQGHRVLVIGASGGVGSFAVQLGKAFGATVAGACSTTNIDLVRSLGADAVIDYTAPDAWEDAGCFDVVLQVGGTQRASWCRRLLDRRGTLVQISGDSDNRWSGPFGRIVAGQLLSRVVSQRIATFTVRPNREDLELLAGLIETGTVRSVIDRTFPLDQVHDAFHRVESGHTRGKVVLQVRARVSSSQPPADSKEKPAMTTGSDDLTRPPHT